ncbi:helix-turn-helix transcriptional regulator [Roseibium litorale]|uniref:Autoinducer binding domain-containing protein n=1 Tax=Roseibium litorale TaxID=2803841 RepID=A0ABR9CSD9_9HYPH|nr:LuxR family transcriptional regulator [Roseibium litorale]MBD8893186.1 autoinducer binding domain-containing protein [Roseibium litorale]
MLNQTMQLDGFIERIARETCPDSLWLAVTGFLAGNGFDKVIRIRCCPQGVRVRTTMSEGFQAYYSENAFERDDPFLEHCLTAPETVPTGEDYLKDYSYLTERGQSLIRAAGEDGFRAGFSVPSPMHLGPVTIGWNLGSSLGRKDVESLRRDREPLLRLALMAVQERLDFPQDALGSGLSQQARMQRVLSRREHQCLSLIADGLRIKAIAAELGIKPVTVDLHLANARKKLGAATREQAVALAFGAKDRR